MARATDELKDEIMEILGAAKGGMTLREILRKSRLADDVGELSVPIAELMRDGDISRSSHDAEGRSIYRLPPDGDPVPAGDQPDPAATQGAATQIERVLTLLHEHGGRNRAEIAAALGINIKRVSDILTKLRVKGAVRREEPGLWWATGSKPPAPQPPTPQPPAAPPAPRGNVVALRTVKPGPLVALRSDGLVEIHRDLDQDTEELITLTIAELFAAHAFVSGLRLP